MKKQTKPELLLDHYLNTLGLWRKPVARDGLSLFRAVSEQLFLTQVYHTNLYEACRIVFQHLDKDPEMDWTEYEVMAILSKMYRRDFLIYENVGQAPVEGTSNGYKDKILLCRVGDNQLDSVYALSMQESAAICQSIVYEILYKGVFKLNWELTEAVSLIREQNKKKLGLSDKSDHLEDTCFNKLQNWNLSKDRYLRKATPPLPYRIAKALDPSIYRNVELDIWEEYKRVQKKETPEYRERFAPGDKCQVILEGEHFHGHIQELSQTDNTATVFIEELGEKQSVLISCLKTPATHRYHSPTSSKYLQQKLQDQTIHSVQIYKGYHNNKTSKYSSFQSGVQSCSAVSPSQGYNLSRAYVYGADMAMTSTAEGYNVKMGTSPVNSTLNSSPVNLNQVCSPGVLQPCTQTAMLPHVSVPAPYMYNPMVANSNHSYSCVSMVPHSNHSCVSVPYLESIAVTDVNMNCMPSQDVSGKDLPEINTVRFFYNLGVENYRSITQPAPMWSAMPMSPMMHPGGIIATEQLSSNICGQLCPSYPGPWQGPAYHAGLGSFSRAQPFN